MHCEPADSLCSKLASTGVKPPSDYLEDRSDSFHPASSENCEWLEKMVHAFLSCVTTGNVKVQWNVVNIAILMSGDILNRIIYLRIEHLLQVQWNVCHALSNLFFNKTLKLQDKDW